MINRIIEAELKIISREFPIIAILGPRQSGKSTLAKMFFKDYAYVSFEDPDIRERVTNDPRGFLIKYPQKVIYDEIQRVPDFISYLQTHVDSGVESGMIVITGSHNYLLMENISQSLAGRAGIVKLLPLSVPEVILFNRQTLEESVFKGGYPRLYDKNIRPVSFFGEYLETYIERDVRLIKNITSFDKFSRFLRVLAGRTGQVLNLKSIGDDCELSHNTVKEWISVLETSYIVYRLKPYYRNYKKQIVKSPKIYFYDTGLVCFLLGIQSVKQLENHYLRGAIIETFYISEFVKSSFNRRSPVNFYYWRNNHQKEIDLIIESVGMHAFEMKSGKTIRSDFFNTLKLWQELTHLPREHCGLVYGGEENDLYSGMTVIAWNRIHEFFDRTFGLSS
jgi:predicted AAA+ superfamily ATPase